MQVVDRMLALYVICCTLYFFASSCRTDPEQVKAVTFKLNTEVEKGRDVQLLYSDSGIIRVKVVAPAFVRYLTKNPYTEMPEGLTVFFYNEDFSVNSRLTARYGVNYEKEQLMKVRHNVVLMNNKGERLDAEELIWDEKQEKVYSDKFVKITTPDEIIYGQGFEADQHFTYYKIRKIEGTIKLEEPLQ